MRDPRCVLVVDDEDELRKVVGAVLEKAGYEVISAGNGRDALEILISGELTPDLILLDLRMPVMDGWEFSRIVSCYHRLAEIPIVLITSATPEREWHPRVDGVLPKPFTPSALLTEVEKHVPAEGSWTTPGAPRRRSGRRRRAHE